MKEGESEEVKEGEREGEGREGGREGRRERGGGKQGTVWRKETRKEGGWTGV